MAVTYDRQRRTAWVGWLVFASVMMIFLGAFHAIAGLVALLKDNFYIVTKRGLLLSWDYSVWGWVHLALGILVIVAAASLVSGRMFGRVVGVIFALISAIVNFAFIASYPVWSVLMIAIDVILIYAIVVHGRELAD